MDYADDCQEMQKARTQLRERLLKFIAHTNGNDCEFSLYENINVKAHLRAVDANVDNFIVENLQTPFMPVDKAIIRSSDIISVTIKDIKHESLLNL